jgi:adenosylhomocysteine nucleosidase
VGLLFALGIEAGGLIDRLAGVVTTEGFGFLAREGGLDGRRLLVVESGIGCQRAAAATQALVDGHRPRWIISAGFAGGLVDELALGDIVMANQIVDAQDQRLDVDFKLTQNEQAASPRFHVGRLLTSDVIVHEPNERRTVGQRYGALAVDMETWAVADVCRREKVRFLSVRVISDSVQRRFPPEIDNLIKRNSTAGRLGAAAGAILRRPSSIKDLWQLREDALIASERLATFLTGVVKQLP